MLFHIHFVQVPEGIRYALGCQFNQITIKGRTGGVSHGDIILRAMLAGIRHNGFGFRIGCGMNRQGEQAGKQSDDQRENQ